MKNKDYIRHTRVIRRVENGFNNYLKHPNLNIMNCIVEPVENYEINKVESKEKLLKFKILGFVIEFDIFLYKVLKHSSIKVAEKESKSQVMDSYAYTLMNISVILKEIFTQIALNFQRKKEPIFTFDFAEFKGSKVKVDLIKKKVELISLMSYFLEDIEINEIIEWGRKNGFEK